MEDLFQVEELNCGKAEHSSLNLLESKEFVSASGLINVPLGQTDRGDVIVRDLSDIPHILIGGFTGTGKTSFVQTIIATISKTCSPQDVKLVIYDSKGIEYLPFRNLPHLLNSIINNREDGIKSIKTLARASEARFTKFAGMGCKDLDSFNRNVGSDKKMPVIIAVFDDYSSLDLDKEAVADFMTVLKNGRIAGIHAIVVSSISSSRVLQKELISNIPCRISFKVTTAAESRSLIESAGAEKLYVPGEMIYKFQNDFCKCRCAYSSYDNIEASMRKLTNSMVGVHELGTIAANIFMNMPRPKTEPISIADDEGRDDLYAEAGRYVINSGKASIGYLQRMLKIGFNRAARLMDQLAEDGVVGCESGTMARDILMDIEEFETFVANNYDYKPSYKMPLGDSLKRIDSGEASKTGVSLGSGIIGSLLKEQDEPEIKLRDFPEFNIEGYTIGVSNHKINYSKPIMTIKGPGHLNSSFSGSIIANIIYRKPSFRSKGYFTFEFTSKANIVNQNKDLLYADSHNISNVVMVEFSKDSDKRVRAFLQQLSEDVGIPISSV